MKYLFFTIYILWAGVSGIVEGILYSGKASKAFVWNEHIVLTIQRVLVVSLALIAFKIGYIRLYNNFSDLLLIISILILTFSLFHNGLYYETRKRIDIPTYNFFSSSKSSSAIFELNIWIRSILFIIGLVGIFYL